MYAQLYFAPTLEAERTWTVKRRCSPLVTAGIEFIDENGGGLASAFVKVR
jgi:hypothetical protein